MRPTAEQKEIIAYNIFSLRNSKYPGWGGSKQCARDFGVSTSHWSPWEVGTRTPDETSLQRLADFFGTTVGAIQSPPEDWEVKRTEWRARKRKRKSKANAVEDVSPQASPAPSQESIDEEAEDYLESIKMLAKLQSLHDRGILSPQAYQAKMKHIIGVIKFVMES